MSSGEAYLRKLAKPSALEAWKRLRQDFAIVLAAVKRQKTSNQWIKDEGPYIPHPTT